MPKNKSYTVYLRYLVTVEVDAKSEDEAYDLAAKTGIEDGDRELIDVTVEKQD